MDDQFTLGVRGADVRSDRHRRFGPLLGTDRRRLRRGSGRLRRGRWRLGHAARLPGGRWRIATTFAVPSEIETPVLADEVVPKLWWASSRISRNPARS